MVESITIKIMGCLESSIISLKMVDMYLQFIKFSFIHQKNQLIRR